MRVCAIVVFCVILVGHLMVGSYAANSKITANAQVTIYLHDTYDQLLGSKTFSLSYVSPSQPTLPEPLTVGFSLQTPSMPGIDLFSDFPLQSNVGHGTCLNSACGDPDYSDFVWLFTDGTKEWVTGTFNIYSVGNLVKSQTVWAWDADFSTSGHDFHGDRIGRICMFVGEASIEQKPDFVGVPEPYTYTTMLGGLTCSVGLWALRRRKLSARGSASAARRATARPGEPVLPALVADPQA